MRVVAFLFGSFILICAPAYAAELPGTKNKPEISVALLEAMSRQIIGKPDTLIGNVAGRNSISLNGMWNIIVDEHQFGAGGFLTSPWFQPLEPLQNGMQLREHSFDKRRQLQVPGDWNTQDAELFSYRGVVWYQRDFEIEKDETQRYFIHFDGVNYAASVYLNGQPLATHQGGYTAFNMEATEHLKSGRNFLVVRVDAHLDNSSVPTVQTSDFFKYGGITRDVNLISLPRTFVQNYHVYLADLESSSIKAWVRLEGDEAVGQEVGLSIPELNIEQVALTDDSGKAEFSFNTDIELWSPDSPKLYDVSLSHAETVLLDTIGFRTFTTRGKELLLNGQPIKLHGISMHDETPLAEGVGKTLEDAKTQLNLIKQMNGNFVRLAHYPHNEHTVRMADKLGLLVWSEIPIVSLLDWDNERTLKTALTQIEDNISRDLNRASIVIWSIANETMPQNEARLNFLAALAEKARSLDESKRPLAAALIGDAEKEFMEVTKRLIVEMLNDSSITDPIALAQLPLVAKQLMGDKMADVAEQEIEIMLTDPLGDIVDIIGYNEYFGWYYSRPLSEKLPVDEANVRRTMFKLMPDIRFRNIFNKPIIISEFGAGAKQGYQTPLGQEAIWTEGYQAKVYRAQLDMLSRNDWVQGWSPWILKDFRSALRQLNGIQDGYNRKGVVSENGKKKQAYYVLKDFYGAD